MTALRQRREPIRSKPIREAARDEECTLQIFRVCVGGTETTVLAHLHDESFGKSVKADDSSAVFACMGCHDEIDGRTRVLKGHNLTFYKLRALQRTVRRLIEKGVYPVKLDEAKRAAPKPRSRKRPSRGFAGSRPIQGRNDLRRKAAP